MSTPFYDLASLVVVPSGYKSGKVYAQKPQTTDGQLAFTRASTATRVNASGLVASVASGVPRLDYTNSTCPKLLLEPQRTNLVLYSEALNALWTLNGVTVTPDATSSPSGVVSADKLIATAGAGAKYVFQILAVTNAVAYTTSAYFKASEYTFAFMRLGGVDGNPYVIYNLSTQAIVATSGLTSSTITSVGNGWYRVTVRATQTSVVLAPVIMVIPSTGYTLNGSNLPEFTGNGTSGGFVWGVQSELGAYPTSYIPTEGTAVTRVADSAVKASVTSLIGQTEGTIFLDTVIDALPVDSSLFGVEKAASNFVIRIFSDGSTLRAQSYNGAANLFLEATSYTIGTRVKIAFAYKAGSYAFYKNGTLVATGANATAIPACDSIMTNSLWGTIGNGKYGTSQALLFKTRLTNAQMAELTAL